MILYMYVHTHIHTYIYIYFFLGKNRREGYLCIYTHIPHDIQSKNKCILFHFSYFLI